MAAYQAAFEDDLSLCLVYPDCSDPDTTVKEEFGAGDLVCGGCELVLGDRVVDTQSEWRTIENDQDDDPSRAGAAADPLMEGMEQLDTIIGFKDGRAGIARELQRAATCSQSWCSERHLSAVRDISSWCDQFSLPKTISDITKQLYKRANEEKLLRRKPLDAVIAACIFVACRQARVPRTFNEICSLTHVSKKLLGRCYKALERAFNLTPRSSAARSGVAEPEDLLVRYCNHLDIPPHVQAICKDIIVAVREHGIADGRNPVSIAGGAIYFTCLLLGVSKTVKDISMVAGVCEGTIKIVYRLYCTNRQKLVKKEWVAEGQTNTDRLTRRELVESLSPPA
ncbi:cyclin-like protein [Lactarius akahatsu]|uniref:Transcription initiation factor IIB n=1 Tax=Lactarius akahatsu TaxID=416441 RepID=A0AAD4LCG4_9AGAM|nr:cyclin-like protein [Lactarius akahatsu]